MHHADHNAVAAAELSTADLDDVSGGWKWSVTIDFITVSFDTDTNSSGSGSSGKW